MLKFKEIGLRCICFIIALSLVLSFAGCSSSNPSKDIKKEASTSEDSNVKTVDNEKPKYEERVKITLVSRDLRQNDDPIVEDDSIVKYLEDKFNMDLDLIYVPSPQHTELFERLNMMVASGTIPDIMESTCHLQLAASLHNSLANSGKLIDVEEFLKKYPGRYPNIEQRVAEKDADAFRIKDNKLFQIPRTIGALPHALFILLLPRINVPKLLKLHDRLKIC